MQIRILVVVEDVVRRQFFSEKMTESTDYVWEVVPLVDDARRLLVERYDAVIIDGDRDASNKINLCREVRSYPQNAQSFVVLFGSVSADKMTPNVLQSIGVNAFLNWPIFSGKLIKTLQQLFEGETLPSAEETGLAPVKPAPSAPQKPDSPPADIPGEDAKALGNPPLTAAELECIEPDRYRTIMQFSKNLDMVDYYQIMGLDGSAKSNDIKKRYYQLARRFHPDRFINVTQKEFMARVYSVFKRMTEAYQILSDTDKRRAYEYNLGQNRSKDTLRMKKAAMDTKRSGPRQDELQIRNTNARKFFSLGQKALSEGNLNGARMNFLLAQQQSPSDLVIKQGIDKIDLLLKKAKEAKA